MTRFEAPRGTHDILPSEQPLWQWVAGEMQDVCALYGYRRIDTPAFEDTELIVRTSGGGSDVVQKETYTFTDAWGRPRTWLKGEHAYLAPSGASVLLARCNLKHDVVEEADLTAERLAGYRVLLVPNAAHLSGETMARIESWLAGGLFIRR